MNNDIKIAKSIKLKNISEIALSLGLKNEDIELYGNNKAKIKIKAIKSKKQRKDSKLILVSAITPTPAGEGKTTISIGLSLGLNRLGKSSIVTLREPSLGPLFGRKGGATGGGYAQVLPMEEINMHFTGDMRAVETAHNLIAAVLDNHIYHRKEPRLDPRRTKWCRVMDMNDRALRDIVIGLGGRIHGIPRESFFQITASSEIMAILCLAENYHELKEMLSNILLGFTYDEKPVYLKDLKIEGAATALLKDALKPNLVQTTEGTPALVHGGPFANIAQGTCSVLSMKLALKLCEYVVTEAGFGFDLGAEKFFDIVARKSGLSPQVVVLVATARALKNHGGKELKNIEKPDAKAVRNGLPNLEKHLENIKKFGVPAIVAINKFTHDTKEEIEIIKEFADSKNIESSVVEVHQKGGKGAIDLAEKVIKKTNQKRKFKPLYSVKESIEKKIKIVSSEIYGAAAVEFTKEGKSDLKLIKKLGLENLPICIAKTQKSLSDDPKLLCRPEDFIVNVNRIEISRGAGFLIPITGDILLMPGLPKDPAAENIDIDAEGNITGLF
ncbi:formate--tetrahydrofolate ligase [candidate division WOR-3 bacterium]|nr:formate--tetrahydrofolate ligase [candidate division WOR-3 bacterium]